MSTKKEKIQMWVACILTAGEWAIAIVVLVQRGDLVMIYLAVTYLIRETSGGKHYHEIVAAAIHRLIVKV